MSLVDELRVVDIFADLGTDELGWLAENMRIVDVAPGEAFFREGEPARDMYAVLEGETRGQKEKGLPDGLLRVVKAGQVSGMLPHSRMTHYPITDRAVGRTRLAMLPASLFGELVRRIPVLRARLASVMADRVKETTEQVQLRERLVGLGRLSAGLAHELNNPAAAIRRSTGELEARVAALSHLCETLLAELASPASVEALSAMKDLRESAGSRADPLARSQAEEELTTFLSGRGIEDAWVAAETLAAAGIRREDLTDALDIPESIQPSALSWLEAHLAARQLVAEIGDAAERISGIVTAVKSYSHMDRAPAKESVDVAGGLESTLVVLAHKVRAKGLRIARDYGDGEGGLLVEGHAGELNQVWTNLIDNAVDASPVGGEVTLRVDRIGGHVAVSIADQGSGIPAPVRERMFEPFFTTKEVGEGSGLGLDIAKRIVTAHRGEIRLDSAPGRTVFEVRLPAQRSDA